MKRSACVLAASSRSPATAVGARNDARARGRASHDHARHPRLVRGLEVGARRLHGADRHEGEDPAGGRRGRCAEPGDPHQGQSRRRRVLRRRQHVPRPRARRGLFEPYEPPALAQVPADTSSTPPTTSRRSTTATCASTTTRSGSHARSVAVPATLDDLTEARVRGHARGREPGDVVARARVPARDDRPLRGGRLARLLGEAARQRREGRRRLGDRVRGRLLPGRQPGHLPARRVVRVEPAGRGVLLEAPAADVADRHACSTRASGRSSSPACWGHRAPPRGTQARRLHVVGALPGGHPAADVRVPGARGHAAAAGVQEVRRCRPPTRCRSRPPTSAPTATSGSSSGPRPCCGSADRSGAWERRVARARAARVLGAVLRLPHSSSTCSRATTSARRCRSSRCRRASTSAARARRT